ncbi:MAG: electron transfer flavoprotein subunit alpha/FixB family protein, partial [Chloroflexi bacterium]|nr:electron transfer flavoprotein subunit alpha/FixB family protein [Chloroflexota bacterium]
MSTASGIWVLAEQRNGELQEVSLELVGEARKLADELKEELWAVLLGSSVENLTPPLAHYGADKVLVAEHPLLENYTTEAFTSALTGLITQYQPSTVIIGATSVGRDLAPRVATRLKTGLVTECTILKAGEKGALLMTKPTHGGKVYTTFTCNSARPQMATVRPGVLGLGKANTSRKAAIVRAEVGEDLGEIRTKVTGFGKADPKTVDLTEAEIIVAGGRGVGSLEKYRLIEELAELLGGSVGGSRVARDAGWVPFERQIGQTGRTVAPNLILTAGISGATQFANGMKDSKAIIVINKDRNAPIFKIAD